MCFNDKVSSYQQLLHKSQAKEKLWGATKQSNEVTSNEVTENRVTGKNFEGSKILKSF